MSLINCEACGKKISNNAKTCPHCGEPVPKQKPPSRWKGILAMVAILYGVTFLMWSTNSGHYSEENAKKRQEKSVAKKTYIPKKERRTTLKGGYFACTSEALFDEITTAAVNKDKLAMGHLLTKGCVLTKAGVRISIVDLGIGTTKIRAYSGSDSVILYTNTENVYY